ncbi:MAG: hypothetical protein WCH39_23055, partial [Schlesneria sp.]
RVRSLTLPTPGFDIERLWRKDTRTELLQPPKDQLFGKSIIHFLMRLVFTTPFGSNSMEIPSPTSLKQESVDGIDLISALDEVTIWDRQSFLET